MRRLLLVGAAAMVASCNDWESLSSTPADNVCIAFVVAGDTHTCARRADGSLLCWGDNRFGQLGAGDREKRGAAKVSFETGATRVFLPAGTGDITSDQSVFGCAVTTDNKLSCWGDNRFGQLGTGDQDPRLAPTRVDALSGEVTKATNGAGHTCAELADGSLWCWGKNTAGQLGTGDMTSRPTPAKVAMPVAVDRLSAGASFTCARGADGSLHCFGSNEYGQLGLGNVMPQTKPVKVPMLGAVVRVTTGAGHTCVFTSDGIVSCWGDNREGQLGTGDRNPRSSPTRVDEKNLGAVTQVYAGGTHTCAQKVDGSLWCWGSNRFGQLGTGDTDPRLTPVQVAALGNDVAAAYSGGAHTCAVKTDGSVWCWGSNQYGQLGVDVGSLAKEPVQVKPACP